MNNLVPRASVVEPEVEGPDKGWLSHDQSFKNSWKIFRPNYRVLMFCNKFCKYIGTFGHGTTRLGRVLHHMLNHKEALGTRLSNKISKGFLFRIASFTRADNILNTRMMLSRPGNYCVI